MAGQTRTNLQAVAMGAVCIGASKPEDWDCWRRPHSCSEIHIERHFGRLRGQFASGEMSARSYWNASAKITRQLAKRVLTDGRPAKVEPPLTPDQFLAFKNFTDHQILIIF